MSVTRRTFLQMTGLSAAGLSVAGISVEAALAFPQTAFAAEIRAERHVLNRLTWGVRPEDVARIQAMGIEAYIDWQLEPDAIDDPRVAEFVANRPILSLSLPELYRVAANNYDFILRAALWGRIFRAVYSERQLFERVVEFWTDHFNVPIPDLVSEKLVDDRDVIRRHALGSFRDLLFASAQSPAMLYYLNNADSNKDHPNENYARELMELHTLGVDGGYTEVDVVEVARAFTGWTVQDGGGAFVFDMSIHDTDEKTVLGHRLPAGRGIEDGLQVLEILTSHSSTAAFVCRKLARRFISDDPPPSAIDGAAQVFTASGGDIREVMRYLLKSPEFMAARGQKFRRPLDAVVAMLRALSPGLEIENPDPLVQRLDTLGQMPYFWHPPNGYPDAAGAWINTSGLLARWNTAMELALAGDGYFEGSVVNLDRVVPPAKTAGELVDNAVGVILGTPISPDDRALLIAYVARSGDESQVLSDDQRSAKLPGVVGLLMASPYFQWV